MDRSVLEIFANDALCAAKVLSQLEGGISLDLQNLGGTAVAKHIRSWPIISIW